jgi:hypothetical protein
LSEAERAMVAGLFAAVDAYGGGPAAQAAGWGV